MNGEGPIGKALTGALAGCLGLALAAAAPAEQELPDELVIHAGTVIAVPGDEPLTDISVLKNVRVVIQGGRVVKDAR